MIDATFDTSKFYPGVMVEVTLNRPDFSGLVGKVLGVCGAFLDVELTWKNRRRSFALYFDEVRLLDAVEALAKL